MYSEGVWHQVERRATTKKPSSGASVDNRRGTGRVDSGGGRVLQMENTARAEARTRKEATATGLV